MSSFTPAEIEYLGTQRLGRLGTVGPNAEPHVAPVPFRYNPDHDTIDVGGRDFTKRKKYHDVQHNPQVAIVIDDLVSEQPWVERGIEIMGHAEVHESGGKVIHDTFSDEMFRIRPSRVISWGVDQDVTFKTRTVGGPVW
jgi:pyridoxamine 5'-phosphate oxidase family protein